MVSKELPIFMEEEIANKILREAISCIPKGTSIYLIGGRIRNALYYNHFGKRFPSRDYDLFMSERPDKFISNLRKIGFVYGKMKRKDEITVKKKKFEGAKEPKDHVVFDIHFTEKKTILQNLKEKSNFTINGFAINLNKITFKNWKSCVISLEGAYKDLKNKQIKVNTFNHPAQIFACIRFVSQGFKPPKKKEADGLFMLLGKLRRNQLEININKVLEYTGGKEETLRIARRMGINEDIFSFNTILRIRVKQRSLTLN